MRSAKLRSGKRVYIARKKSDGQRHGDSNGTLPPRNGGGVKDVESRYSGNGKLTLGKSRASIAADD